MNKDDDCDVSMRPMMCRMMITVASAPPPSLLELQAGVAAGPEPHPRRSTRTDSKYLQGPFEKCKLMKARGERLKRGNII